MKKNYSLLSIFIVIFLFSCGSKKPGKGLIDPFRQAIIYLVPRSDAIEGTGDAYCRTEESDFIMIFANSGSLKSSELQGTITFSENSPIIFTIPEIPERIGNINGTGRVLVNRPPCDNHCQFSIQWSNQPAIPGYCNF